MKSKTLKYIYLTAIIVLLSSCGKQQVPPTEEAINQLISMFEVEKTKILKDSKIDYIHGDSPDYLVHFTKIIPIIFETSELDFDYMLLYYFKTRIKEHQSWDDRSDALRKASNSEKNALYDEAEKYKEEAAEYRKISDEIDNDVTYQLFDKFFKKTKLWSLRNQPQKAYDAGVISESTAEYMNDTINVFLKNVGQKEKKLIL